MINTSLTQAQSNIAGIYKQRSNDPQGGASMFVLEDHKFVVVFFGGALVGEWSINGNDVEFKPFKSDQHFLIYGRHNPDLKTTSRIYFQGFNERETFIGFGEKQAEKQLLKRVFNVSPNCVPYPSVSKFRDIFSKIYLSDQPDHFGDVESDPKAKRNIYAFTNKEKYNDFIAYYIKDNREEEPFYAKLKGGELTFERENFSAKRPLPTSGEDFEFIEKIAHAPRSTDKVFYNPFYNRTAEDVNDIHNWKFNEKKNAYISFLNYTEGEEYKPEAQDAYNKMNIVYQFNILPLTDKVVAPFSIDNKPLFTATCD